jgi:hypothetical protein
VSIIAPIKRKRGLKGIKGLKGIGRARWRRRIKPRRITLQPEVPGEKKDPLEAAALQGAPGTLPERIVQKFLENEGLLYQRQAAEFGGSRQLGGQTLDFVVYGLAAFPVVLRVQGQYWHGPLSDRMSLDDEQAGRLRLQGYLVVDLFEQEIYRAVLNHNLRRFILGRVGL